MRIVVDTNILISSLIKDSITREILLLPYMDFYLPEFALEEVEAHKIKISKLSGLSPDEIDFFLDLNPKADRLRQGRKFLPRLTEHLAPAAPSSTPGNNDAAAIFRLPAKPFHR